MDQALVGLLVVDFELDVVVHELILDFSKVLVGPDVEEDAVVLLAEVAILSEYLLELLLETRQLGDEHQVQPALRLVEEMLFHQLLKPISNLGLPPALYRRSFHDDLRERQLRFWPLASGLR